MGYLTRPPTAGKVSVVTTTAAPLQTYGATGVALHDVYDLYKYDCILCIDNYVYLMCVLNSELHFLEGTPSPPGPASKPPGH